MHIHTQRHSTFYIFSSLFVIALIGSVSNIHRFILWSMMIPAVLSFKFFSKQSSQIQLITYIDGELMEYVFFKWFELKKKFEKKMEK